MEIVGIESLEGRESVGTWKLPLAWELVEFTGIDEGARFWCIPETPARGDNNGNRLGGSPTPLPVVLITLLTLERSVGNISRR